MTSRATSARPYAEEVDLAFLLDVTGSMGAHIEGAKLAINGSDETPGFRLFLGKRASVKAWCLLIHAEAHLSLSPGPGRNPGASLYMRKRLSLSFSVYA